MSKTLRLAYTLSRKILKAMTDAILQLAADPDLRSRLGRNGREYIINKFSRKQTAAAYVKVLEEVLKPKHEKHNCTSD